MDFKNNMVKGMEDNPMGIPEYEYTVRVRVRAIRQSDADYLAEDIAEGLARSTKGLSTASVCSAQVTEARKL
jgi:hypothetical protein